MYLLKTIGICALRLFSKSFFFETIQEFESILFPKTILIKKIFNRKQKPDLMVP